MEFVLPDATKDGCGNDFCQVIYLLDGRGCNALGLTTGYLDYTKLNDPLTKGNICGGGNPTVGGASYASVSDSSSYTFTLTKESGGTSTFTSPQ